MKPIEVQVVGRTQQSPQEICTQFLDTSRWSEFTGYAILPGIKEAYFEARTSGLVGSRIRVQNTDGSSHVEEIIEWDVDNRIALRFHEFSPPLQRIATHFVETWEFRQGANGTDVTRKMGMYPKGWPGWMLLMPISRLMKKAFERNLVNTQ